MGSMVNPKPWVPYMNTKDCSQGFCSLYCPQWCYIMFLPPPPFELPDDSPGPSFSPIVIAIIGILGSAFLLVSYYAIISKYCKNRDSRTTRENNFPGGSDSDSSQDHSSNHFPWNNSSENGLDEALIKSIRVFKYKKGDDGRRLIEGADCSVCLSEFQDDESLRILPKCSHAFHVICIDTWLKSHSNCPLCRAIISLPPLTNSPQTQAETQSDPPLQSNPEIEDLEMGSRENGDLQENGRIRRSVSMDCICPGRLSIADVMRIDQDEEEDGMEQSKSTNEAGGSKWPIQLVGMSRNGNIMKRSFSSGRFPFSKAGRGRNLLEIPL